jgi:hypothetical protein
MTTRNDWKRRWTHPQPNYEARPDRAEQWHMTVRYVHDMHELGAFLYHEVITDEPQPWFKGTGESIMTAIRTKRIAKPHTRVNATMLNHALILYSGHTTDRIDRWVDQARNVTAGSYVSWLVRHEGVKPFAACQPSPFERETLRRKR